MYNIVIQCFYGVYCIQCYYKTLTLFPVLYITLSLTLCPGVSASFNSLLLRHLSPLVTTNVFSLPVSPQGRKSRTQLATKQQQKPESISVLLLSFVLPFRFPIPGGSEGKASAYNAGDPGSTPGLGRPPGEGNGNPLQHSCLENTMD